MFKKYLLATMIAISPVIAPIIRAESFENKAIELTTRNKPETYESAAEHRGKTADTQTEQALKITDKAFEEKSTYEKVEEKRMGRYLVAGNLELSAAELQVTASRNYQYAQSNLTMALEFYKRLPRDMQDKDRLEKIRRQIEIYRQNYNSYLQKGIKTYLIAAESFSAVNAANSEKEAIAYEKIAVILENLAKEKQ